MSKAFQSNELHPIQWFCCLVLVLLLAQTAGASLSSFETANFSGSGICAMCHSRLQDEAGNDVSNDAHWRSTLMANSAKDPLWQAKVSSEVAIHSALGQIIQEKCSRCHMGMARYQQIADGSKKSDIYILGDGFLSPDHYLHRAAMDGVSCTLCHQVQAECLGTEDSYTGQYVINTDASFSDRILFGPNGRSFNNPMHHRTGFMPTYHAPDNQLADSAHCATCHTLYTPALDGQGNYLGEFPEQTTYLEWRHSGVDLTCQECHLPAAEGEVVLSNRPRGRIAPVSQFNQHHYVGGNSFMLGLLNAYADNLGVTADASHLEATARRTMDQLRQNTARVEATTIRTEDGNNLQVVVKVENLTGHKFPSGFPSRRAWLHVAVANDDGEIIFESGRPLGDGRVQGCDGDTDSTAFEPHYETISSPEEVQIYEAVMLNFEKEVTFTLLRAWQYAKDNRLLPAGFDKGSADGDIAVHGAAADDDDFSAGSDQVLYNLPVGGAKGGLTVRVELLFQSLSYPFIADLGATGTVLVERFMGFYDPADNVPVVIAKTELSVE